MRRADPAYPGTGAETSSREPPRSRIGRSGFCRISVAQGFDLHDWFRAISARTGSARLGSHKVRRIRLAWSYRKINNVRQHSKILPRFFGPRRSRNVCTALGEFRSDQMSNANNTVKPSSNAAMPRMRIAQIAPLYERIPPKLYGGTERTVSYITEELVRRGHDVTLFAAGDAQTSAKLHPACPQALRLVGKQELGAFLQLPMLSDVYENADDFDVIHTHIDYWSFAFAPFVKTPTVSTMHGRLDIEDLRPIYARYTKVPLVSISDAQRTPLPFMNWVSTIYHGLPTDLLSYSKGPGKYLAFLGRISPEKRPDLAIDIACKAGLPIKLAAKVDVVDRAYFDQVIKPRLAQPGVEYIGEINESQKNEFLGNAIALMFTIDWPEPFGLAMIEALACGP